MRQDEYKRIYIYININACTYEEEIITASFLKSCISIGFLDSFDKREECIKHIRYYIVPPKFAKEIHKKASVSDNY